MACCLTKTGDPKSKGTEYEGTTRKMPRVRVPARQCGGRECNEGTIMESQVAALVLRAHWSRTARWSLAMLQWCGHDGAGCGDATV